MCPLSRLSDVGVVLLQWFWLVTPVSERATCFPDLHEMSSIWRVKVQSVWSLLLGKIICTLCSSVVSINNCLCMTSSSLRSSFSIANQIKFDLRFTDLWLTWCSELIVDQLCFVFPCIFDLQLRDRWLVDQSSTELTLCQSDWLTVTLICDVVLNYPACAASGRHSQ